MDLLLIPNSVRREIALTFSQDASPSPSAEDPNAPPQLTLLSNGTLLAYSVMHFRLKLDVAVSASSSSISCSSGRIFHRLRILDGRRAHRVVCLSTAL